MTEAGPEGIADRIRRTTANLWDACHDHEFTQALGRGDLDESAFRRFIVQEHVLLADRIRVLALACVKALDPPTQARYAEMLASAVEVERPMHTRLCIDWGMSTDEIERAEALPTTLGYGSFLVSTATTGGLPEITVALLGREWPSTDSAVRLQRDGLPHDARYAAWIDTTASERRTAPVEWLRRLIDHLGDEADDRTYLRWRRLFRSTLRYELAMRDMALTGRERWPDP